MRVKGGDDEAAAEARRRLAALSGRPPPSSGDEPPKTVGTPPFPGRHAAPLSLPQRLIGWLADRLPLSVRSGLGVTSSHVSVVAALLALCLATGSWLFLQSRPEPVAPLPRAKLVTPTASGSGSPTNAISAAKPPVTAAAGAAGTPTAAPTATASMLVVDVTGRVRRPGIVELPPGSRVADALEAAGGARPQVDLSTLNLARLLVDGEQILVGVPGASGASGVAPPQSAPTAAGSSPATLVNLNTATQEQLETLPGIGPVTAVAILTWRDEHGLFSSVDELLEVSGIGDATLADLRPYVTV